VLAAPSAAKAHSADATHEHGGAAEQPKSEAKPTSTSQSQSQPKEWKSDYLHGAPSMIQRLPPKSLRAVHRIRTAGSARVLCDGADHSGGGTNSANTDVILVNAASLLSVCCLIPGAVREGVPFLVGMLYCIRWTSLCVERGIGKLKINTFEARRPCLFVAIMNEPT
jgi:hypothetical protein